MEERLELAETRLRELLGELTDPAEQNTENGKKSLPGDWRDFLWYRFVCYCSCVR